MCYSVTVQPYAIDTAKLFFIIKHYLFLHTFKTSLLNFLYSTLPCFSLNPFRNSLILSPSRPAISLTKLSYLNFSVYVGRGSVEHDSQWHCITSPQPSQTSKTLLSMPSSSSTTKNFLSLFLEISFFFHSKLLLASIPPGRHYSL